MMEGVHVNNITKVLLTEVTISALNSRKNLSAGSEDANIDDLARSIAGYGVLQPPSLRRVESGRYEVIAGQRRILACKHLGMKEIDAMVVDFDDDHAVGASLVENLQRADMDPLDKARGFEDLVRRTGSERGASRMTGVRTQTVRRYLALLELPDDLRGRVGTGEGPTGIGALSTLARHFVDEDASKAWDLVKGFDGGTAERLIRESKGDIEHLRELQGRQLDGEFNLERCGANLSTCPWVMDLPSDVRHEVIEMTSIRDS